MSSRKELSGKKIGSSHAECVLKASLTDIIKGDVDKGKTRILDFFQAETKKGSVTTVGEVNMSALLCSGMFGRFIYHWSAHRLLAQTQSLSPGIPWDSAYIYWIR